MQNWSYKFRLDNSGFLAYDEFNEIGRANFAVCPQGSLSTFDCQFSKGGCSRYELPDPYP